MNFYLSTPNKTRKKKIHKVQSKTAFSTAYFMFSKTKIAREAQKLKTPNSQDHETNLQSFTDKNQTSIC